MPNQYIRNNFILFLILFYKKDASFSQKIGQNCPLLSRALNFHWLIVERGTDNKNFSINYIMS